MKGDKAMKMNIREFIEKYCKDIVENITVMDLIMEDCNFPFEEFAEVDGKVTKVIYDANGVALPIRDILCFGEEDFKKIYSSAESQKAYDNYVANVQFIEGDELLERYTNLVKKESTKAASYKEMFLSGDLD